MESLTSDGLTGPFWSEGTRPRPAFQPSEESRRSGARALPGFTVRCPGSTRPREVGRPAPKYSRQPAERAPFVGWNAALAPLPLLTAPVPPAHDALFPRPKQLRSAIPGLPQSRRLLNDLARAPTGPRSNFSGAPARRPDRYAPVLLFPPSPSSRVQRAHCRLSLLIKKYWGPRRMLPQNAQGATPLLASYCLLYA